MEQNLIVYLDKVTDKDHYIIYTAFGKELFSNIIFSQFSKIEFSKYPPGTYIVKIVNDDKITLKKFVRK